MDCLNNSLAVKVDSGLSKKTLIAKALLFSCTFWAALLASHCFFFVLFCFSLPFINQDADPYNHFPFGGQFQAAIKEEEKTIPTPTGTCSFLEIGPNFQHLVFSQEKSFISVLIEKQMGWLFL